MPVLFALMMLMLALKNRGVREQLSATRAWAPLGATMLFVLLWAACGGSPPPPPPLTETYNLTLTATASGVSKTSTLTLTVN